ncbi:MAG: glycoside hydrolase [Actinomycetota bacterium]|nr:glycoside hydrolase [Actinomycetota bacterium]
MSLLRRPVVLMVIGFVVLALAGVTFSTRHTGGAVALSPDLCSFPPCRAAFNPAPARGYESAYVVADPKNPDHVVITDTDMLDNRCGWHTTVDRGKDWTDGFFALPPGFVGCRINAAAGGHVPNGSVQMGPSGTIYSVFGSANPDEAKGDQIMLAKSTDGGKTFAPAQSVAKPPAPEMGLGRPLMTVVAGPTGDSLLLSFWLCHPGSTGAGTACDGALFARSDDGGNKFSPPVLVNDPPAGQNPSQPVMDNDGIVYETFQRRFADGPVDLYVAKSTDGGKTFTQGFIDRQIQIGIQYDPAKLAFDPKTNTLYTVWSDSRTGRQQIFFRKSIDKGVTWGDKAVLLAPDAQFSGSSRSPSISLAPDGRIDIVYYHTGPAAEVANFDDVYWSSSTDGGDNFTTARQVNDMPIDRTKGYSGPAGSLGQVGNHYPPTVASIDGAAFVVWSDTVNGDARTNSQDTMLRRMPVTSAAPPP